MSTPRTSRLTAVPPDRMRLMRQVAEILSAMPYEAGRARALDALQRAVFAGGARARAVLEQANLVTLAHTLALATASLRATGRPTDAAQADVLETARRQLDRWARTATPNRGTP